MPPGIFRDPKMNQRERNYGIIWSEDKTQSFFYRKKDDWTRLALFGEVAWYELDPDGPPIDKPDPEDFEVAGTVVLDHSLSGSEIALKLSPVYTRIGRRTSDSVRWEAIREAIENGLPSDFETPPSMK
jgi:hypothetical protein